MADQTPPPDRIKLQKWNVVTSWNYVNTQENCSICHNPMTAPCLQCTSTGSSEPCNPAWGVCSHTFHLHCISLWLRKSNTCALCSQQWEWKTD